jgi:hypothetical protein
MEKAFDEVFMKKGVETLFFRVRIFSDEFSRCLSLAIHPPDWLPGTVGCSNTIPISPL